jgi:hypothetical protein
MTDPEDLARLTQLRAALQPTRWVLLRRAALRPRFRAEQALHIARAEAGFQGSETTARFHATWLQKKGYLSVTEDNGRLAYCITVPGRHLYDQVVAAMSGEPEPIRSGTESHVVAIVASMSPREYEVLADARGDLDLSADLRQGLESVLTARARVRVEPIPL